MTEDPHASGLDGRETQAIATISAIWCEVLNVATVPCDRSFLAIGGDSISGTLCVNRLRRVFGRHIALDVILQSDATVDRLAALLDGIQTPATVS